MQGSDVELLPLMIFPSPCSAFIFMFLAPSQKWHFPEASLKCHLQTITRASQKSQRAGKAQAACSWGQTGSTLIVPAIPSTLDSQRWLQEEGLAHSVPLFRKVLPDMAKHAAKHPLFGEEQSGTCRNTPAISASLPQTVPWLHPSPHSLTSGSMSWGNVRCYASMAL